LILTHDKNRAEADRVIAQVKQELRSLFVKSNEQIKKVGNVLKKVVKKEESICEEIKIALKEEIAEGVISTRTIELHCPPEWKRKTKPKQRENEKISFSKPQQQQITVTQEGKSVTANEITSNTKAYNDINQPYDESKQNGTGVYGNSETQTIQTNQGKLDEPKANIETSTIDNYSPSDTVKNITSDGSDKQECSHQITIPREKYRVVTDAMDKSKASILVKFDRTNRFLSADPDVYNGIPFDLGANHQDGNVQPGDHTYCERRWRGKK
jgi:K+/H+ antiporter YhaU regulatory subunit KhtT